MADLQYDEYGQMTIDPMTHMPLNQEAYKNNVLAAVQRSTLRPDGAVDYESDKIKLPLKMHQRRSLWALRHNEQLEERISSGANFSFYCDNVGAGKSLTLLALVAKYPIVDCKMNNRFLRFPINFPPEENTVYGYAQHHNTIFNSSLIVVPHTIYSQWEGYIKRYTTLKYIGIKTGDDIESLTKERLEDPTVNVVLCKSTKFSELMYRIRSLLFITNTHFGNISIEDRLHTGDLLKGMNKRKLDYAVKRLKKLRDELTAENEIVNSGIKTFSGGFLFQRVIYDEACDIRLKFLPTVGQFGLFTWFVSSSVGTLLGQGGRMSDLLLGQHYHSHTAWVYYWPRLVIRNDEEFVKTSFNIPDYTKNVVRCLTPHYVRILNGLSGKNIISPEAMAALSGGDVEHALELMGIETTGDEDIIESLIGRFKRDLSIRTNHLEQLTTRLSDLTKERANRNARLAELRQATSPDEVVIAELVKVRDQISSHISSTTESIDTERVHIQSTEQKIKDIKERIEITSDRQCPICMGDIEHASVTPCCNNLFCVGCLMMSISASKSCPMCRAAINPQQIKAVQKGSKKKAAAAAAEEPTLPTKLDALFDIMDKRPDGRFLIFTSFDQVFTAADLHNRFVEKDITYDYLKGNSGHITALVNRFNEGKLKMLILNARFMGSGINLEAATDTIIFHRLEDDIERQVIGRAQRPGRTEPLKVHYLYYDNEFKFA